jgi:hypothetical protein
VHGEHVLQDVGLVASSLAQADLLGSVEVVQEHGLVLGVGALLDDDAGTLTRSKTTDISVALLSHKQAIQVSTRSRGTVKSEQTYSRSCSVWST